MKDIYRVIREDDAIYPIMFNNISRVLTSIISFTISMIFYYFIIEGIDKRKRCKIKFNNREKLDMILVYGAYITNATRINIAYAEKYPN